MFQDLNFCLAHVPALQIIHGITPFKKAPAWSWFPDYLEGVNVTLSCCRSE